jgi:2-amino-4-hydroxy-6-hydroxymethyldihydropteridine diphosphokinase
MLQGQKTDGTAAICLIAVGSNLPSQAGSVSASVTVALELLAGENSVELIAQSRLFQTPAYPAGSGPDFVNGAVTVVTSLAPRQLLACLHEIEAKLGRTRTNRWEARVLDLDLLACGDIVLPDRATLDRWISLPQADQATATPDQLILPHPRLQDRAFVLVPLADIAPDWRHPILDKTVREMLHTLPASALDGIKPLAV